MATGPVMWLESAEGAPPISLPACADQRLNWQPHYRACCQMLQSSNFLSDRVSTPGPAVCQRRSFSPQANTDVKHYRPRSLRK
jgi:hypothetical protein